MFQMALVIAMRGAISSRLVKNFNEVGEQEILS